MAPSIRRSKRKKQDEQLRTSRREEVSLVASDISQTSIEEEPPLQLDLILTALATLSSHMKEKLNQLETTCQEAIDRVEQNM